MTSMPAKSPKIWIVTGAARGLGLEIVRAVLASGDTVIATVRNGASALKASFPHAALHVATLDVTDEAGAHQLAADVVGRHGKIDVLVNNAGFGLLSAVEEATDEEIRRNYETNVFGLLKVTRAVVPHLRRQRSGHVINLSSIGGLVGSVGWGVYGSTKFAVEGLTEAMARELAPLGVHVTAVEPGYFRTNFLDGASLTRTRNVIADYAGTAGKAREMATALSYRQPGDPAKLAAAIVRLAASPRPPVHLPLGRDTLAAYRAKSAQFEEEIADWHDVITSTDHADVTAS
jgi:NAD(P)-dependent dehydrogenase (short-subunit alcohol dehydrogenase family)